MKQREILLLVFSTFILVIAWIGFSIYHNLVSSTITKSVEEKIVPIDPSFDTKTIDMLKERRSIEQVFKTNGKDSTESAEIENISTESASQIPEENL